MLLVDSLYINGSGGLSLLQFLVETLQEKKIDFFLLADKRCSGIFDGLPNVRYMKASLYHRYVFYRNNSLHFRSVFCFGNVPPPIKLSVPAFTYFHNINLLTLEEAKGFKAKILSWAKRQIFRFLKKNTDYWIVQTENTSNELQRHLKEPSGRLKVLPFYKLPKELLDLSNKPHGNDYVFVSKYRGTAKGHDELLQAWRLLHEQGVDITLHLTVSPDSKQFIESIKKAQEDGVKIVNHGFIPFNNVIELYEVSKTIIYPSRNESLGLGIIEAIAAGCDVVGANLPYIHTICKPSEVFNPYDINSIVNAVLRYEKGKSPKSELLISNHISDIINLVYEQK